MRFEFFEETNFKETELGPLPEDWQVVRLGDVVNTDRRKGNILEVIDGVPFIPMNLIPNEGLYIKNYEFRNLDDVRSGIVVYEGELLLAKITPSFENGKQGILKGVPFAIATTEVIPIKTKDNICDVEFLFYNLKLPDVRNQLAQRMEGTTGRRRLSKNVLYNLLFPLPPLEEQKAIAEVLRAVQEVIEKTEKVIRATKELKKSMMKQLFTYGVYKDASGNWKIGNPETVEVKETEIGLIPKHWEVVRLEKVLFEIDKRVYQLNQTNSSDLPVLSLTKNDGLILQSQRFEKRVATEDTSKYKVVHKNHIVYNPYVIWEGAIHILEKFDIGIVSPVYVVLQVIDNMAIPEYVDAWLRTATALMLYSRLASGTVNRRRAIKKRDFLQIAFPLPPLEEQKQIAQILQAIDQKIEKEENYKKALKNLFKSLLHSLMNGKIRVRRV